MKIGYRVGAVLLVLAVAQGIRARDITVPPPDPEFERQSFHVADGFEVNLWAADPLLAKPIQMNFDPEGRLWVASSSTYPQVKPGETPNDKVIILEDTQGVGHADKATVFADGLFIPTGIAPGDGGVYVANSTELVFLKDTTGSGKADQRTVMLTGFGTEDTHHIIHTFRWGLDGHLFFNQSIYIHSHVETPWGVKRLLGGGTWRFRPETMELEVFTKGLVNGWGHCFTYWGASLGTDGAGGEGVNYFFPGATFCTSPGAERILKGNNPGSPKYASAEIISGRHMPDEWQGSLITNDFRGNRIVRFAISEEGSGFNSKLMPDVIKSTDSAFRPVDVKMGPDGALYIADWYNPVINHGEVDFRDPRRDHTHGRIWRLTAKGRPLVERPQVRNAAWPALLDLLKAPEDYTRAQARRVILERGAKDALPALATWVKQLSPGDKNFEHDRLEALWMYQGLNTVEPALLAEVLRSKEPGARAAATRVLRDWHAQIPNTLELLATLIADEHPRVRLETVCTLEAIPSLRSIEIAMQALDRPMDNNIDYALWHCANGLKALWLPAVESGALTFNGNVKQLSFALQAAAAGGGSERITQALLTMMKDGKVAAENREKVASIIASIGSGPDLKELFNLGEATGDSAFRIKVMKAIGTAVKERGVHPGEGFGLERLFNEADPALYAEAVRLSGILKLGKLRQPITDAANNAKSPEVVRAAFEALTAMGGPPSVKFFNETIAAASTPSKKAMAILGLAALDTPAAVAPAAAILGEPLDGNLAADIVAEFTKHKGAGALLAAALAGAKPRAENATAGLQYLNASGVIEPELAKALKAFTQTGAAPAGNSPTLPGKTPAVMGEAFISKAELDEFGAQVKEKGDPLRGEQIFRRKSMSCFSCHAIGGAGGQVGPDLSSVGSASPLDYLIESVLYPNKAVKEGYNAVTVFTKTGEVFNGIVVRKTARQLILRDGAHDEIPIALNQIEKQRESGSLMPNGLADTLSRGELSDLVRFLSALGTAGPFSVAQSTAVRRWRVLDPVPDDIASAATADLPKLLAPSDRLIWGPAYSDVSGVLPKSDWILAQKKPVAFARFEIEMTTPGKIGLRFNSTAGITLFADGVSTDVKDLTVLDLKSGTHMFTLRIDGEQRGSNGLKIDPEEVAGSAGHFQRVGGK